MIIIEPYYEIDHWHPEDDFDRIIRAARICYQSEPLNTQEEKELFLKRLIERGHFSPLEHSSLSVIFVTNRGVTHELVRHRIASYCQESTRYCNYSKAKFDSDDEEKHVIFRKGDGNVRFIWDSSVAYNDRNQWYQDLRDAEITYYSWLENEYPPQIARAFLPNALKTEIIVTANLREWRHIFELRCDKAAHPHIRELLIPLLKEVQHKIPVIFDDVLEKVECQEK